MFVAVANAWAKFAINAQQQKDGGEERFRSGIRIRIGSVNSFVNATRQQLSISLSLSVLSPVACLWIWFVFLLCHSASSWSAMNSVRAWHSSLTLGFISASLVISLVFGPILKPVAGTVQTSNNRNLYGAIWTCSNSYANQLQQQQ